MSATFYHGEPVMIDYTPGAAVAAGDIVQIGTKTCVAHSNIAANDLGALSWPGGQSAYKITNPAGVYAVGDPVTVDLALGDTSGLIAFGIAVRAAVAGEEVYAMLDN